MPRYLVEKHLAEGLELPPEVVLVDTDVRADDDIPSLLAGFFGYGPARRFYLYEAPSSVELLTAVREAGLPADVIRPYNIQP